MMGCSFCFYYSVTVVVPYSDRACFVSLHNVRSLLDGTCFPASLFNCCSLVLFEERVGEGEEGLEAVHAPLIAYLYVENAATAASDAVTGRISAKAGSGIAIAQRFDTLLLNQRQIATTELVLLIIYSTTA